MKKRHLSSWSLCSLVFLQKVVWRRQRGKNLILAATGIRYQLDLVDNNILGGAVDEDENSLSGGGPEVTEEIWVHWPRHRKRKQNLLEGASSEVDGTQLLTTSSQERGAATEAHGKNTATSTESPQETSRTDEQARCSTAGAAWDHLIKQPGLLLPEIGAHSRARMCSTVGELAGKSTAIQPPG